MPSIVWPHQCSWLEPVSWEFSTTGQFLCGSHRDYPLLPVPEAWSELCLVPVRGSVGSQFLVVEWELHMHKAQRTLGLCTTRYQLCKPPSRFSQPFSSNTHPNQYSYGGLLFLVRDSKVLSPPLLFLSLLSFHFYINFFKKHKNSETKHKLCCGDCLGGDGTEGRGRGRNAKRVSCIAGQGSVT